MGKERGSDEPGIAMKLSPIRRKLAIGLTAALFWMWPVQSGALDQKAVAPRESVSGPPSAVIPPGEVPMHLAEALDFLHSLKTYGSPNSKIEEIERALPEAIEQIGRESERTAEMLEVQPTLFALQARQELWRQLQLEIAGWLKVTAERATQLRDALDRVEDLRKMWTRTLVSAQAANASGPVVQQIESTLAVIEATQKVLQPQHDAILDLESRISAQKVRCDNSIAEIAEAQREAVGGIMTRGLPIWSPDLWAYNRAEMLTRAREIASDRWADISLYARDSTKGMPFHVGLFLVLVVLFSAAGRQVRRWIVEGRDLPSAANVFDRPYACALLVPMGIGAAVFSPAPPTVRALFPVLALVPMLRLMQPAVDSRVWRVFWLLGGLIALDTILQLFGVARSVNHVILILEIIGGTVALRKLDVLWGQLHYRSKETVALHFRALHIIVTLCRVGLAVALLAGLLGYAPLAWLLTSGILAACVYAFGLYAFIRILDGMVALALNSWPLGSLQIVRRFHEIFERRAHRVFVWLGIAAWVNRSLDFVGLREPVLDFGRAVFGARLRVGSLSISVANVLAFIFTVVVAYLLSAFIRFVLREDLYQRIGVERGLSYAISKLLHYTILGLGFVLGVAALGVNFTQVSILVGALGVGIGFGLQSVVNNFVSGLILLFERPIHVGDTIQVGDMLAEVRRIGIRASTVRTRQGAEIIVPNAQLITEKVTNWTLSDRLRRIDLPVGLNYGADPRKAIQLLEAVARRHPNVLQKPAPRCLLIGYGDSSMNFQLRAWTDQFDDWQQISSDLASAVYDAVIEAGFQFPFPQREVRLLRDADACSISEKNKTAHKSAV
ncbi:MAG: mechanosensitive ion channel domain-containing protein [Syntrophobacteraceae bacterium]